MKKAFLYSEEEVSSIIEKPKQLKDQLKFKHDRDAGTNRIRIPVYLGDKKIGLEFVATYKTEEGGFSTALLLNNQRIRCTNRYLRYRNPDGEVIEGWHEHKWTDEYGALFVHNIGREFQDIWELIDYSLDRWNIAKPDKDKSLFD